MNIFGAGVKYLLRRGNDSHTNKELSENKGRAYKQTGKKIAEAKKNGTYINGSRSYKETKKELDKTTLKKSKDRDKFIDDL